MKYFEQLYYRSWYQMTLGIFSVVTELFMPIDVTGQEHLVLLSKRRGKRGVVIVSNHRSYFDVLNIAYACRGHFKGIRFLASHELVDVDFQQKHYFSCLSSLPIWLANTVSHVLSRLTRWFVVSARSVLVDRDNDSAKINRSAVIIAVKMLFAGGILGIFPQGGIDRSEAKNSAVKLAEKTNSMILPIHIKRKPKKWGRKNPWRIVIGHPIDTTCLEEFAQNKNTDTAQALMLLIYDL